MRECVLPCSNTQEDKTMAREDLGIKFDMLVCRRCKDALYSRGERYVSTESPVIDIDDELDEPCRCEWCDEVENLYGIWFR